jgi:hypothetical protein
MSPPKMLQEFGSWDTSLWGRLAENNIYCASTDPVDSCPKADPWEQRGLTLYTIPSRLQKQKGKLNPHMATYDFIGYSFPQCYVTFMFQFFKFYLSALPSPPPVSLSKHQPVCFFSVLLFLLHYRLKKVKCSLFKFFGKIYFILKNWSFYSHSTLLLRNWIVLISKPHSQY